jgi:hypothetical protein
MKPVLTDMFQVYEGNVEDLSAYSFMHVLQDPGCFYFFAVAYNPGDQVFNKRDAIIRRDLCWLTGKHFTAAAFRTAYINYLCYACNLKLQNFISLSHIFFA